MNRQTISDAIGSIEEKYVAEAAAYAADVPAAPVVIRPAPRRSRWGFLAACLALLAVMSSVVVVFAAEAREYNAAVAFFEENGLSVEGLSRADIKAVYRDITAQRFTYEKTADVIRQAVPGVEITQETPTPEQLADLWGTNVWLRSRPGAGVSYRVRYLDKRDDAKGFDVLDKSVVECYRNGELLWTVEVPDVLVQQEGTYTSAGSFIWGSDTEGLARLLLVDDEGRILWQRRPDHGFKRENIAAVLDDGDGTCAVISRGDLKFLCLSRYDAAGSELSFKKTEIGLLGIWNAARLGDGYIVQVGNATSTDTAVLLRLDRDGTVRDSMTYEGEDCAYFLADMVEFGGQVYLSAYAVPQRDESHGRYEIEAVLETLDKDPELSGYVWPGNHDAYDEYVTALLRDNYTAVLLLCDPASGTPKTFYSVQGSLGDRLTVNDAGQLEWEVQGIVSAFFSPVTSSFSIGGTCEVFRYTFDTAGTLIAQTDTGEAVQYRR